VKGGSGFDNKGAFIGYYWAGKVKRGLRKEAISLSESAKIEGLRRCQIFGKLSPEEFSELASRATAVTFRKRTFIFSEGDPPDFFYMVYDGLVRVFKTTSSGRDLTFKIAASGETLNASALSLDSYFVSAQAMTNVVLLRIARKDWLPFVIFHPAVAVEIIALTALGLNREFERTVNIVGEEVEPRLVHSLCVLVTKFGTTLSFTRNDLADFVGTTTETTIRILSKLKKKGVISGSASRGEIVISDLARLQNYLPEARRQRNGGRGATAAATIRRFRGRTL
jgi:CRP-like cAMP-binding protein